MRERDSAKRTIAQRVARSRFSIQPKKETRLRINEGMAESIHHDARDIAFGIKTRSAKHLCHLLANLAFVINERSGHQFRTTQLPLSARRQPRLREVNKERKHRGQIWPHDV